MRKRIQRKETIIPASSPNDLERTVETILASLDADKAQDIRHIDLVGKTTIADRMIVASGTSARMVSALAQHLVTKLKAIGLKPRSEGEQHGDWVLVDAGDVIVHLFRPEVRAFYDIERIWNTPVPTPVRAAKPKADKPARKTKPRTAGKTAGGKTTSPKTGRRKAPAKKAPAR